MAELYNYVVVSVVDHPSVQRALLGELSDRRGWKTVRAEAAGARHVRVWRSRDDFTVIELDGSWEEGDRDLAKAVSKRCDTQTAAYYFTGAGEWEFFEVFDRGRSVASSSLSDATGEWEIREGGKTIFHRDWGGSEPDESEYERARAEFASALRNVFATGPLAKLVRDDAWSELAPLDEAEALELSFLEPQLASSLAAVQRALERWIEPLLSRLELERGKAEPRQGDAAIAYERSVGHGTLRVQYSFDASKVFRIEQRFEFVRWDAQHECWLYPHVDIGSRQTEEFQPYRSSDHLDRSCRFLAASLAREWKKLAELVPELSSAIENASKTEAWRKAADEYEDLFRTRLVARERDPGWKTATLVFKGAGLMVVATEEKERFTFKFDTSTVPDSKDLAVGGIWEMSAGGARARELKIGETVLRFDEQGVLQTRTQGENAPPTGAEDTPKKPWWKAW